MKRSERNHSAEGLWIVYTTLLFACSQNFSKQALPFPFSTIKNLTQQISRTHPLTPQNDAEPGGEVKVKPVIALPNSDRVQNLQIEVCSGKLVGRIQPTGIFQSVRRSPQKRECIISYAFIKAEVLISVLFWCYIFRPFSILYYLYIS